MIMQKNTERTDVIAPTPKKRFGKLRVLLVSLLVMMMWGALFSLVKVGYKACSIDTSNVFSILLFAGIRFAVCGVAITAVALIVDPKSLDRARYANSGILLTSLFAIILHYAFTYTGLALTDSGKTAILKQVGAPFYVCFSFLFFKEDKPTVWKLIGALLGFAGILAINSGKSGIRFGLGDFLIIGASFCSVISNIISKNTMHKVSPLILTGLSQLSGGAVLMAAGWFGGGRAVLSSASSILSILLICAVSSVSYCLWYLEVKKENLSKLFIIKFAEPVFACLVGILLLGEKFTWNYVTAFLLISFGILLSHKGK